MKHAVYLDEEETRLRSTYRKGLEVGIQRIHAECPDLRGRLSVDEAHEEPEVEAEEEKPEEEPPKPKKRKKAPKKKPKGKKKPKKKGGKRK